ncbi:50S ribosomal protein L25/general stress protein Ctc [Methylosoma difficile]
MSKVFEFIAESRVEIGKCSARRARHKGNVPAVIYGGHKEPQMLVLNHNEVIKHLEHEAVYSHVLDITVDGKTEQAILKAVQRNPAKFQVMHLDFQRVNMSEVVKVHVPLHFVNEQTSVGVKKGGAVSHLMADVEVVCLPSVLPEYIEVDLQNLDVGGILHLSDLVLPSGVELVELSHGASHDQPVASVVAAK